MGDVLASPAGQGPNVVQLLQRAGERLVSLLRTARDADLIGESHDTTDWGVPSVTRHQQNAHRGGFVPLTELITGALLIAAQVDAATVRRLVSSSASESFNLLTRLWMHGLTHAALYSPYQAIDSLATSDDTAFGPLLRSLSRSQGRDLAARALKRPRGWLSASRPKDRSDMRQNRARTTTSTGKHGLVIARFGCD